MKTLSNKPLRLVITSLIACIISACASNTIERRTLAEIDTVGSISSGKSTLPKSDDDIRKAYANYLKHASKDDDSRAIALNRLAELEFELSERLIQNKPNNTVDILDEQLYNAKLDRTIELLTTSLRDYPKSKTNDRTLYQLAKAHDQRGNYQETQITLETLVTNYPESKYYIESQFRLAERAFSAKEYRLAEDKYTEIIGSKRNNVFFEKSLYKRGWSRFKQEFYIEAVDDFLRVVNYNQFDEYPELEKTTKNLFDEYFRAIGLSFTYLGGAVPLKNYFEQSAGQENFKSKHLYYVYTHVSDIFYKQERYSDAVKTLTYFAQKNPTSKYVPEARLKTINIWKTSGFLSKMYESLETFYADYNPDSGYWKNTKNLDERIFKTVKGELKSHILTVTANYHKQFQLTKNQADFINAKRWYNNYLQHYSAYSHKDNIHYLLGTLLAENNDNINALKHYELSGFDSDIIINKNAAYESILLASKLLQSSQMKQETSIWLNKLINFSTLYSQQYPTDTRTSKVIAYASELAYKNNLFDKTIILSELINTTHDSSLTVNINRIKAHSYFKTGKYVEAENTYLSIFEDKSLTSKAINSIKESLALAIYYQGKSASEKNHLNEAIHHYARIIRVAPDSDIAATGLYDAIALTSQTKQWKQSIGYIESFRNLYPKHKHAHDVSKKLSVAYLNTEQNIAAAQELEQLSKHEKNKEYRVAALLKAGELYESKKDYSSAIRSYEQYVKNFPRPFPQYMESMLKLVELNTIKGNQKQVKSWQNKIIKADKKAQSSLKNKRTHYISSVAALELAKDSHIDFSNAKLVLPLNKNLKIKKQAMQKSVNLFAQASSYGDPAIATEATHKIADIYREFSQALLNSERPKHLNKDELEQYKILLEDQAFPFEEKAIEFYEINLVNVKDDIFNQWIEKSHSQLKKLFPVRYARDPKLEEYINVLH